jgi:hypothetical protein
MFGIGQAFILHEMHNFYTEFGQMSVRRSHPPFVAPIADTGMRGRMPRRPGLAVDRAEMRFSPGASSSSPCSWHFAGCAAMPRETAAPADHDLHDVWQTVRLAQEMGGVLVPSPVRLKAVQAFRGRTNRFIPTEEFLKTR